MVVEVKRALKYKHEVRITDAGDLQSVCYENNVIHWRGTAQPQGTSLAGAHAAANTELNQHVTETGHVSFKQRHGGSR